MSLTYEVASHLLEYNKESGRLIWKTIRSGRSPRGGEAGYVKTCHGKSYRVVGINYSEYQAHVVAFLLSEGRLPDSEIDHIDGNGLNNKWDNLREVSHAENQKNRRRGCNNKSGHVGVIWHTRDNRWYVFISVNKRQVYVGCFRELDDAIAARLTAAAEHGYHANHGSDRPL